MLVFCAVHESCAREAKAWALARDNDFESIDDGWGEGAKLCLCQKHMMFSQFKAALRNLLTKSCVLRIVGVRQAVWTGRKS